MNYESLFDKDGEIISPPKINCETCGCIPSIDGITTDCHDPEGCGKFEESEYSLGTYGEDLEEDSLLEELNFNEI